MGVNSSYQVGDVTITRVPELILSSSAPEYLFPEWDPAVLQAHEHWLIPGNMDEKREHLIQSVHTWVLRTKQHTVLIDTGAGNDKERPWVPVMNRLQLPYLERLKAAGVTPEEVDYVILTHLHVDHVGWNTRFTGDGWAPTFPKAKYVFAKTAQEYYADPDNYSDNTRVKVKVYEDSVLPVLEAGQAEMIGPDGGEVLDGLILHPTPGHSIAHMSVRLISRGEEALFGGDVMHHPLQVYYPEWNSVYCVDAKQAGVSRLWALEHAAERQAIFFSSHFAESSAGFVTRKGDRFQWRFR